MAPSHLRNTNPAAQTGRSNTCEHAQARWVNTSARIHVKTRNLPMDTCVSAELRREDRRQNPNKRLILRISLGGRRLRPLTSTWLPRR